MSTPFDPLLRSFLKLFCFYSMRHVKGIFNYPSYPLSCSRIQPKVDKWIPPIT